MSVRTDRPSAGSVSRRAFVAASGAAAAAAVAMGSEGAAQATEQKAEESTEQPVDYQVFETDIIVIGAGMAAMCAVDEAIQQGQNVLVIDKAPFGFGGASGMNWDVCYTWNPTGEPGITGSIRNNAMIKAANDSDRYGNNSYVNIINMGEVCSQRNEDGSVHFKMDFPYTQMVEWGFPRHWNDQMAQRGNVTVHDYTMVTDIFVNDGRCIGCVGIYLPTGEYRVYRSKATVLSTGGCTQMYGWVTLSSVTNQSTDNTADVDMGIFRHGGRIGDAEHGAYDMMGIYPTCWASSEGAMFGGDSMDIDFMLDNEGVAFCLDPELDQERMLNDRPYFNQIVAKHIQSGKGGPNGGIFLPATTEMREQMRYMYLRCVNRIEAQCGIDLTTEPMECMIEMYEHGGTPLIDDQMMSTEFAGLFCSRGAGSFGVGGGATNLTERQFGQYAMKNAIAYAQSAEPLAEVDFSDAEREIARLEDLRTREAEDGIRPVTIQREIQELCSQALNVVRTQEELDRARDGLRRIYDEELPRMTLANHSSTYNRDWKDAIETVNLLDIARLSVEATYVRPESRGNFLRPEFPEPSDDWACTLAFYQDENGDLLYDKVFWAE